MFKPYFEPQELTSDAVAVQIDQRFFLWILAGLVGGTIGSGALALKMAMGN